ncbi:MAG: hypothetical protein NTX29_07250 [Actinobacteria bacterium]|nr:hypothetical protein [Actinomycetota bacterium]
MFKTTAVVAGAAVFAMVLTSCAGEDTLNTQATALVQRLSAQDAKVPNVTGPPECESPREHVVEGSGDSATFRVICRVFYMQGTTDRWKQMLCIGTFSRDPMLDYCYDWAPYETSPS